MARRWIDAVWSKWYDVTMLRRGIHGFQDCGGPAPALISERGTFKDFDERRRS
jgi:hypothetical protein